MEHRWNKRADVRFDVSMHRRGMPAALCMSRNASLEGMFLELDADALDLQVGTAIEVAFRLRGGEPGKRRRSSAVVMHRGPRGVGLMLATFQPEVLAVLAAAASGRDVGATAASEHGALIAST
jgi:hypothetical protein